MSPSLVNCAVVGAGGKMGRGIALLLLQEMALLKAQYPDQERTLCLIDLRLGDLRPYLRSHLTRFAEKQINSLRQLYAENASLVSNGEMIQYFVQEALDCVRTGSDWHEARDATEVFEAIVEDVEAKVALYSHLRAICSKETRFFSNTSSIPIGHLSDKSALEGRLFGLHFYNPPPVQKLVEVIAPAGVSVDPVIEMALRLQKRVVQSEDVAGFISNGFFIRELKLACELARVYSPALVDRVTKEQLLRPMGIFELVRFVGVDVCEEIAAIMTHFLGVPLEDPMIAEGAKTPSEGSCEAWKALRSAPDSEEKIALHFATLFAKRGVEAELAERYLQGSKAIAKTLLEQHVAKDAADVAVILKVGFQHLYSPLEVTVEAL